MFTLACVSEGVEWTDRGDHQSATVDGSIFHYYPREMRMEWRGRSYRGVHSDDIDRFVENRRSRA